MSKIGRKPILIPEGVNIESKEGKVVVGGPNGVLERVMPTSVIVERDGKTLVVKSVEPALWGTWRAHIANMVEGVTQGFEKKLELHGVGYKVSLQESVLVLQVGFSHSVNIKVPEGLSCEVKENTVIIRGIDKEKVGQFSASIRSVRPPDSYKGKGIRYEKEIVRLKPGKKAGVGAK